MQQEVTVGIRASEGRPPWPPGIFQMQTGPRRAAVRPYNHSFNDPVFLRLRQDEIKRLHAWGFREMNDGGTGRICGAGEVPLTVRHVWRGGTIQVNAEIEVASSYLFEFIKAVHIADGLRSMNRRVRDFTETISIMTFAAGSPARVRTRPRIRRSSIMYTGTSAQPWA